MIKTVGGTHLVYQRSTIDMDWQILLAAGLVMGARGLAILTVAKIGFLVTARGGSGIVIARLPGGGKHTAS